MGLLGWSLLALCFSVCVASDYVFCPKSDAAVVQAEWSVFYSAPNSGTSKYLLGTRIFEGLFLVVPEAKSLFTRLNVNEEASPGFQAHVVRVINGLDICINSLSRPKLLESVTDHMATQHFVRVGVTHEHFDVIEKVLFEVLPHALDRFDTDAWSSCISPVMKAIARGLF